MVKLPRQEKKKIKMANNGRESFNKNKSKLLELHCAKGLDF